MLSVLLQTPGLRAGNIEPILTETDAVAGLPLVMPVRISGSGSPRPSVTLRFPDGQEVRGDVAAVRLERGPAGAAGAVGWLPIGASWQVLTVPEAMRSGGDLAWFVIADLPQGVVGQEIWLDGKPVRLRWLSRPAVLAMRLGFDAAGTGNPLTDPWTSPVPDDWRRRADLLAELRPAMNDPARAWRARLATEGLYPSAEPETVAITPELLTKATVDAASTSLPIKERLVRTVSEQAEARWRVALARLWSADPSLSLRVRHALAGAGMFGFEEADQVVAPLWAADDRSAALLLTTLLDEKMPVSERAVRASEWLEGLRDVVLWTTDDGLRLAETGRPPSIGALLLRAGDAGAIPMGSAAAATRPTVLRSRTMASLRPETNNGGPAVYRIAGSNRGVRTSGAPIDLVPPGVITGPFLGDWTMSGLLTSGQNAASMQPRIVTPVAVITADDAAPGSVPSCRVLVTLPKGSRTELDGWSLRIWIGPFDRSRAVVIVSGSGSAEIQQLPGNEGPGIPLPVINRGVDDSAGNGDSEMLLEILLPREAADESGLIHIGIEAIGPDGARSSWPRRMLPWQVEPARRAINPTTWLGGLGR